MIVYGDRSEQADAADELRSIRRALAEVAGQAPGIARHGVLIGAFIRLGQLVQGVADRDFAVAGEDGCSADERMLMPALVAVARAVIRSWNSGFAELGALPELAMALSGPVEVKLPEGYAYYALYPEAYAVAAARLALSGAPRVIGLRSIGTGLAAIVAARVGAPPPLTVRPAGHPFAREVRIAEEAQAVLLDGAEHAHFIVVDEGPGLSGSSFAAVAGWLEARGVSPGLVSFVPAHANGPGSQASAEIRRIWAGAAQTCVSFAELVKPERVAGWLGLPAQQVENLSAGAWREVRYPNEAEWPAVDPWRERIKYRVALENGDRALIRFAGLGAEGERKFARARTLHMAGFTPEPLALAHGFIAERWIEGVSPDPRDPATLAAVVRYLGGRARLLGAAPAGASLGELLAMARFNLGEAIGADATRVLDGWEPRLGTLAAKSRPVAIDGRLDLHEWLRTTDGRLLKTDALDHDAAHDLIGAQDLAWDAAGALVEFDVAKPEPLLDALDRAAPAPIARDLLAFLLPCYIAFRLGAVVMAAGSLGHWPEEAARNHAAAERYRAAFARFGRWRA